MGKWEFQGRSGTRVNSDFATWQGLAGSEGIGARVARSGRRRPRDLAGGGVGADRRGLPVHRGNEMEREHEI